jgi:prepilin-type N-terminal cleavage/methylation domain-containing protein
VRNGFTLIEILIALVIFEFGMLALAATTAMAARDLAEANHRVRAQTMARNRLEQLRAGACELSPAGGAEIRGTFKEFWRVEALGPRRIIADSVEFPGVRGRPSRIVLRGWTLCPS